jgi:hypothetical protein
MKTQIASQRIPANRAATAAAPLHIVLTSDPATASASARKMLDGLLARWAPGTEIHRDDWSFSELEHPKFFTEALELAATADMLVIAVSGVNDLPQFFIEWLNDWIRSRAHIETALILAISSDAPLSELPHCASILSLPRADGLSIFATTINLERPIMSAANPKSWLARLAAINPECLPENSGLND